MKRILQRTFFVGCGAMLSLTSFGQQQIPNSGFENWENVGTNTEEPLNWNSNKTGSGNATIPPKTISRESSIVHSGSYSAKIKTESYLTTPVNGVMTTGRVNAPTFSASDGYNDTRTDNNDFNCPLTHYPDSIVFWAHYTQGNGTDRARVAVTIHDNYNQRDPYANDPNGSQNVVANATLNFPTTNGWQRISVPFDYATYASNNKVPAYILVNLTSSNVPGSGSTSSVLYVDDLELIYNPNVVSVTPSATQNILIATPGALLTVTEIPNAASAGQTITREWKYSTTSGSGYQSFATAQTGTTFAPQFADEGTYYVICETSFGTDVVISNEVVVNVFEEVPNLVGIAPVTAQNIEVNQAGTTLTVTETPSAAGSREWKFSTTSGSGYMSFPSDEFGLTYTPLFTTAGTYYVVCESDFNGEFVVSNEVQINVSPSTGGLNEELIQVVLFQKDNQLVVDLTAAAIENPVFQLISMDGKTVAKVTMSANTSNLVEIDFVPGVYIYQLSNGQTRVDGKIMIK
jgi:plastocyanin